MKGKETKKEKKEFSPPTPHFKHLKQRIQTHIILDNNRYHIKM